MQRQQAGSLAAESLNVTVREGGDEGIEGPIIMHSALLDPGRGEREVPQQRKMCIFKYTESTP